MPTHTCFVREYLERRKMTQEELARLVGRRLTAINPVVNGKRLPKVDLAVAIAQVLEAHVEELWPGD